MSHTQEIINNTFKMLFVMFMVMKNMALRITTIFLTYNFNSRNNC